MSSETYPDDAVVWPVNVNVGEIVYPPGGTSGPRTQPNIQLVMIHSGHMTVWIDDFSRRIRQATQMSPTELRRGWWKNNTS